MYILTTRGIDLDAYFPYLASIRDRLPAHVASFAGDSRHYSLDDHESLHDAWLESLVISEGTSGTSATRECEVVLRLLGPFHDRVHVLHYTAVRRYDVLGRDAVRGLGDVLTHEVRLAEDGQAIVHEILFEDRGDGRSRVLIECGDFTYAAIPHLDLAG